MRKPVPIDDEAGAELESGGTVHPVLPDVACQRYAIANVAYLGDPRTGSGRRVLVDAGIPGATRAILRAVEQRFGADARSALRSEPVPVATA
jgi:hypothetical protein